MPNRDHRLVRSTRRALVVLPLWVACVIWVGTWWLSVGQVRLWPIFVPLTLALCYEFVLLPSVFLYFVLRASVPEMPKSLRRARVAIISLCVPSSESLDVVENQLRAMAKVTYKHDSWILDEGNSPDIKALAAKCGVRHFSRKGIDMYNQPGPPFQAKTKAGNVNAWLHHVKDSDYDFFVQLDIDHLPRPDYLKRTLRYFRDPNVAWVQAPSVYKNLGPWVARAAAEQELVLQGPLQMGFFGHSRTPFIIGSHCTYRTAAVREIGGFQPTRAEDHLDTVHLAGKGYTGVFLPEIIAEGDGPETLETYLAQQFAWAYSMFQVLLGHTPKLIRNMPFRCKFQFLFAQTWYPLWSLSYLILFAAPVLAFILGREVIQADPFDAAAHFLPLFLCGFLVWWSARPLMQPPRLRLSWRGVLLHAVRWPVILRALLAAAFKIKKPYMVTPKGSFANFAPRLTTYRPFLLLGLATAGSVVVAGALNLSVPQSQIAFALVNSTFMLAICVIDVDLRLRDSKPSLRQLRQHWLAPLAAIVLLLLLLSAAFATFTFEAIGASQ